MCAAGALCLFLVMLVKLIVVDSLKLVHDRQRLAGAIAVAGLLRLAESLQNTSGDLDYSVAGDVDRQDRPLLRLRVSGVVQLQCQRCLDGFEHDIHIETALRLVAPQALDTEYDDNPDEPDCIAARSELDLTALIEDEVLLALPAYPHHARQAGRQCQRAGNADTASAKILAFSALAALKSK